MPKAKKVSISERKLWLEQYENGGRLDEIALKAGRGPRAVKDHISIAQAERDLTVVRHGQLRGALEAHQRDLIGLLSRILQGVELPQLDYPNFLVGFGPDFGLEGLLQPDALAPFRRIGLGSSLGPSAIPPILDDGHTPSRTVYVLRDQGGPKEVGFTEERSRLWKAVREHLRRSPLWKDLDQFKLGLREMLQSRANLNRMIMGSIEDVFGLKVVWEDDNKTPNLRPALVSWLGWIITKNAGGAPAPDPAGQVKEDEGGRGRIIGPSGTLFARLAGDPSSKLDELWKNIPLLSSGAEAQAAGRTENELIKRTTKVREVIEELMLIHFIPGKCSICGRLGGG